MLVGLAPFFWILLASVVASSDSIQTWQEELSKLPDWSREFFKGIKIPRCFVNEIQNHLSDNRPQARVFQRQPHLFVKLDGSTTVAGLSLDLMAPENFFKGICSDPETLKAGRGLNVSQKIDTLAKVLIEFDRKVVLVQDAPVIEEAYRKGIREILDSNHY